MHYILFNMDNNNQGNLSQSQEPQELQQKLTPKKIDKTTFIFLLIAVGLGVVMTLWGIAHMLMHIVPTALVGELRFANWPMLLLYMLEFFGLFIAIIPFLILHFIKPRKGIYLIVWLCLIAVFGLVSFIRTISWLSHFSFERGLVRCFVMYIGRIILQPAIIALFTIAFVRYFKKARKV